MFSPDNILWHCSPHVLVSLCNSPLLTLLGTEKAKMNKTQLEKLAFKRAADLSLDTVVEGREWGGTRWGGTKKDSYYGQESGDSALCASLFLRWQKSTPTQRARFIHLNNDEK